jgi:hypothetical protein
MGSERDGGYLLPNDLDGIEYCFSPGVNVVADFENQLADRGIRSFMADYSVESPPIMRPEFTFDRMFLGAADHDHFFTLQTWKEKYLKDYKGDLLLQMDIEGAEYEVILSTPTSLLDQFRIIVIEFHGLDRLFDEFVFHRLAASFDKLLVSFAVAHIHPNNIGVVARKSGIEIPDSMEFTFLNKKRVRHATPRASFPHKLDAQNSATGRPVDLPRCWYAED